MNSAIPEPSTDNLWATIKRSIAGDQDADYTSGPIGKAVFLLSVPMVLEMLMESVFAVADIFFVARLGAEAVAVVGLTEAVLTLVYALAIGLSMAATAMVSRRIGEKRPEAAAEAAGQVLLIGLVISAVIGTVGVIYAGDVLQLMGATPAVVEQGVGYTSFLLGGSVTIMFLFLINAIFRGAGDASIAMRSLWLANGVNLILDPCLIFGLGPFPEMGVTGAAIATNIGRGVGVVYQLYYLLGVKGRIQVELKHLRLVPKVALRFLQLSVGGVGQFLVATSSWIVLVRLMATYGSTAVAGYTIANRVIIFALLPCWGMGNAAATLVGQNLGAGKPERAQRSVWTAARFNFIAMTLVAIVFIVFPTAIIGLFDKDPEVLYYGVACLRWISYGFGFYAIGTVVVHAFNGAGDTFTPTLINLACFWLLQIPLAYTLAKVVNLGPTGVFIAVMVAESILAVIAIMVFRRGRWKSRVV